MATKDRGSVTLNNFNSTANLADNPGFQSTTSIASVNGPIDEKKYNPFEHRQIAHPNSSLGSLVHLLKAALGTGILAMPAAFKNAGLAAGVVGTALVGLICTHCVHIFVKSSQEMCVEVKRPSMGFAETCEEVFLRGPKPLRSWAGFVKEFVDYSLAATYLGVLCVYVVFIGTSCKEVFDEFTPHYKLSTAVYCIMPLLPLILICQIRNLKYLVPFSAIANVLLVGIFGITMYYMFTNLPPPREREMVADFRQWPLFISTALFAMEGIGVVMPIENEMAKPQQFLGCPGVLNVAMFIVIVLYGVFGFFGYVRFGDDVKGSITLNLPPEDIIAQSAKFLMAVVILFSYGLQFYVPMEMIWRRLRTKVSSRYHNLTQIVVRTTIVTGSVAVAAAFPDLENVISLVGAVFFSTLGLIIPVIIETVHKWNTNLGPCKFIIWKNIVIGIVGFVALISGSYSSVKGMFTDSEEHYDLNNNNTDAVYGQVVFQ